MTGPEAIAHALRRLDLAKLEQEQRDVIKTKKVSKRPRAVAILNAIEGMKRNNITPGDLLISQVPVLPPAFRPFSILGETFAPGDANELYRDLVKLREAYTKTRETFGDEGAADARLALYDGVKSLYGYADPVEPKTKQRGVSGFLRKISGVSPKFSYFQRKMLSKPMDAVGRSVIGVDPELGLDEVGIPREMAWRMYAPYIQARLVRTGMSPAEAVKQVKTQSEMAFKALEHEVKERPVVYSRAPAWHKFSTISGWGKLHDGKAIMINPLVTTGMNADFDGDQINIHVPAMEDAVNEAKDILLPSRMLFSNREPDKVLPVPKHEMVTGIYAAGHRSSKQTHYFPDEAAALQAIQHGKVSLSDEVEIGKPPPPVLPSVSRKNTAERGDIKPVLPGKLG